MGTRVTPNFANVYMGRLEERFVYQAEWVNHIILWVRFIDDIFLILEKRKIITHFQQATFSRLRPKSLRDRLVPSRFVNETPQNFIPKGCRACERTKCSWCKKINQTTTFTSPNNNKTFTIFHTVDCQSSWIIYIIECNICKLQYIGKSETAFNLR